MSCDPETCKVRGIPMDFFQTESLLKCPNCGGNNVVPTKITCLPAEVNGLGLMRIDHSGHLLDGKKKPDSEGVTISIEFACNSCDFKSFMHQFVYKDGVTYIKRGECGAGSRKSISRADYECRAILSGGDLSGGE